MVQQNYILKFVSKYLILNTIIFSIYGTFNDDITNMRCVLHYYTKELWDEIYNYFVASFGSLIWLR